MQYLYQPSLAYENIYISTFFFNIKKWNIIEMQENSQAQGVLKEHSEVHSYKVKGKRKNMG